MYALFRLVGHVYIFRAKFKSTTVKPWASPWKPLKTGDVEIVKQIKAATGANSRPVLRGHRQQCLMVPWVCTELACCSFELTFNSTISQWMPLLCLCGTSPHWWSLPASPEERSEETERSCFHSPAEPGCCRL